MSRILVVDDEEDLVRLIATILKKSGHEVVMACSAKEVLEKDYKFFDLILLDVMMPEMDGFELCKQIRNQVDAPIIFLTAKSMENDIMYGLATGADDYLTKPFGAGELRARVEAHLRREQREKKHTLHVSGVDFNLTGKEMLIDGERMSLTKSEYLICEYLACNKGQVFTKESIYEKVYGYEGESDVSTITVHIKNIRIKLKPYNVSPIETVWGIGYKWV
ncbi:MAG: response regulator transcription factor [Niameybacter sp.]|uniref:response regulator transcription factor n=1 Tax=Niameybacter sp. TaxID=2033640 RepID=UPI002FC69D67